jgi:hypothetical protein
MGIDDFLQQISMRENYETFGRKPMQKEVDEIESGLNISLPASYRQLVECVGSVSWFGGQIFGISREEQGSTVNRTLSRRRFLAEVGLSNVLKADGNVIAEIFGGGFCFLHATTSNRAGKVSAHAPDQRYAEVQYWLTFEDYLSYVLNRTMNWYLVEE